MVEPAVGGAPDLAHAAPADHLFEAVMRELLS